MKKISILAFCVLCLISCGKPKSVTQINEKIVAVDSSMDAIQDTDYIQSLIPIKEQLNEHLDVKLGYAPKALRVYPPECEMLNWASDALYDVAAQYMQSASEGKGSTVDFAVVNIGGMRCEWEAGDITRRSVYELMPFDNELVILALEGKDVLDLADVFAKWGGQGVSRQFRMEMKNKKAQNVTLNGKPIDADAVYYIATSDYLSGGTDHMTPFLNRIDYIDTDNKIRDLYIDYIAQKGVVEACIDGRMKQL